MLYNAFIRLIVSLAVLVAAGAGCGPSIDLESGHAQPISNVNVALTTCMGWSAIERRVRRGVSRAVRSFRFEAADSEDVTATAIVRAWRVFTTAEEPIRNPESWGRQIAERVCLDELRHQKRDRLRGALPMHAETVALVTQPGLQDPADAAGDAEAWALLHQRVNAWPEPERRLAQLLLDGRADTVTAAAWLYRAEEEARCGEGTMYPQRARTLLEARRRELEDLV